MLDATHHVDMPPCTPHRSRITAPGASPTDLFADLRPSELMSDAELGCRLGFKKPRHIRNLMKRYTRELEALGPLVSISTSTGKVGRPTVDYHLSREQCLLLAIVSEVPAAIEARHRAVKALAGKGVDTSDARSDEAAPKIGGRLGSECSDAKGVRHG